MRSTTAAPTHTPWGTPNSAQEIAEGIYLVSTPSHGGIMVSRQLAGRLSPAAQKVGAGFGYEPAAPASREFFVFEEDCDWKVAFAELVEVRSYYKGQVRVQYGAELDRLEAQIGLVLRREALDYEQALEDDDVYSDMEDLLPAVISEIDDFVINAGPDFEEAWRHIKDLDPWLEELLITAALEHYSRVPDYPYERVAQEIRAMGVRV